MFFLIFRKRRRRKNKADDTVYEIPTSGDRKNKGTQRQRVGANHFENTDSNNDDDTRMPHNTDGERRGQEDRHSHDTRHTGRQASPNGDTPSGQRQTIPLEPLGEAGTRQQSADQTGAQTQAQAGQKVYANVEPQPEVPGHRGVQQMTDTRAGRLHRGEDGREGEGESGPLTARYANMTEGEGESGPITARYANMTEGEREPGPTTARYANMGGGEGESGPVTARYVNMGGGEGESGPVTARYANDTAGAYEILDFATDEESSAYTALKQKPKSDVPSGKPSHDSHNKPKSLAFLGTAASVQVSGSQDADDDNDEEEGEIFTVDNVSIESGDYVF